MHISEWNEKKFKRIFFFFRTQGGVDVDGKDDLDSGDEAEGKKIDTEEVSGLDYRLVLITKF